MQSFHNFVPSKSIKTLQGWIDELDVKIIISPPRKTKLGDFKFRSNRLVISINNNLNPYSFLITLTHELAHAFVYKKNKNTVKAHGKNWQITFKHMMLNFLTPDYFPDDILRVLSLHIKKPKASTFSDISLAKVLRKYNSIKSTIVDDINLGEKFKLPNGSIFVKGKKKRKRYMCIQIDTNKNYLFHPLTNVLRVK